MEQETQGEQEIQRPDETDNAMSIDQRLALCEAAQVFVTKRLVGHQKIQIELHYHLFLHNC